ncbi:cobalamin biosynthesis protein CbiA [Desulfosarcina sp. OttesenSCG-928-A07]|nr:cobalamin biosynthesis protein CbiA [Desulfosarcina sp. OttesenSCG-928-A07]
MELKLGGIVIIVGAYGSGKTEVAINLAVQMHNRKIPVRLADLDLVNPYFRTREARHTLERRGIDVVLPPVRYMHADLPILTPEVSGMLRDPKGLTLLDVGGDDVGATVLAALADALKGQSAQVLQVINPHRPYTDTLSGCLGMRAAIEAKARMRITGIVGNTNLIDDTTAADILTGYGFSQKVAEAAGLPLAFITAPAAFLNTLDKNKFQCPILPIHRQLVPPWKHPEAFDA